MIGVCCSGVTGASLEDHTGTRLWKALNGRLKTSKATFKELGLYFEEGLTDFVKSDG